MRLTFRRIFYMIEAKGGSRMKRLCIWLAAILFGLVLLCACAEERPVPQGEEREIAGVTFEDVTTVYDGTMHEITVSGTLPEGVTAVYKNNRGTDAGIYDATAILTGEGYRTKVLTARLTVSRAQYSGLLFESAEIGYDGLAHLPVLSGAPSGAEVVYTVDGKPTAGLGQPGRYTVTATVSDLNHIPCSLDATLTIRDMGRTFAVSYQNFVYYADGGLCRFDGETAARLSPLLPTAFAVADGKLYFLTADALYVTDGDAVTKVADGGGVALASDGISLYYIPRDFGSIRRRGLYDGARDEDFSPGSCTELAFAGGSLWCTGENGLERVGANGTRTKLSFRGAPVMAGPLTPVIREGEAYLFFSTAEGIVRYDILAGVFSVLTSDMGASFTVIGQDLYYLAADEFRPYSSLSVMRIPLFAAAEPVPVFRAESPVTALAACGGKLALFTPSPQLLPAGQEAQAAAEIFPKVFESAAFV